MSEPKAINLDDFKFPEAMENGAARWERDRLAPFEAALRKRLAMPEQFGDIAASLPWFPHARVKIIENCLEENDKAIRAALRILKPSDFGTPTVTFTGHTGAGKTTHALGLALMYMRLLRHELVDAAKKDLEAAKAGAPLRKARSFPAKAEFFDAKAIIDARRFSPLGEEPRLLERARDAALLILDDIVGMRDTEGDLYRIIWERDNYKRATVITTAMSPADMTSTYSEMFTRRVLGGYVTSIERK